MNYAILCAIVVSGSLHALETVQPLDPTESFVPLTFAQGYRRLSDTTIPARAEAQVRAQEWAALAIRQQYLPLVRMNAGTLAQRFFTRQPSVLIESDWTAWSFAGPLQRYAQAKWNIVRAEAERINLLRNLRGDFEQAMLRSARVQRLEDAVQSLHQFADIQFEQTDIELKAGLTTLDSYRRAQQLYAQQAAEIRSYPFLRNIPEYDLGVTIEEFRAWYTLPEDIETYVTHAMQHFPTISYRGWIEYALENRPEVIDLEAQIQYAVDESYIRANYYWPTVHLFGSLSHVGPSRYIRGKGGNCCYPGAEVLDSQGFLGTPGHCTQWFAGIRLDWEFDWNSSWFASQQADADRLALVLQKRHYLFELESEVGGYHDNVNIAMRQLPAAEEALQAAATAWHREELAWRAGLSTKRDVAARALEYEEACARKEEARLTIAAAYTTYRTACVYPDSPCVLP